MEEKLKNYVDQICENYYILRDECICSKSVMIMAGAIFFTAKDKKIDKNKIEEAKEILKNETHIFSTLRGQLKSVVLTKIAESDNPKEYFSNLKEVYNDIKLHGFSSPDFSLVSAIVLLDSVKKEQMKAYIDKSLKIYESLKHLPNYLEKAENLPFACLLAVQNQDVNLDELKEELNKMKDDFFFGVERKGILYSLIGEKNKEALLEKTKEIGKELINIGLHLKGNYKTSVLALLARSEKPTKEIVKDIKEVDEVIKKLKGMSFINIGKKERLMLSSFIVATYYFKNDEKIKSTMLSNLLTYSLTIELIIIVSINFWVISSSLNYNH